MQVSNTIPINRVELESQILCVALRQSLAYQDKEGIYTSIHELTYLFPELLPLFVETAEPKENINYYHVLGLQPQAGLDKILTSYLRHIRNFLKQNSAKTESQAFNKILNAGLVLRKPRLRLSHDLAVAKHWLYEENKANLRKPSTEQPLAEKQSSTDLKTTEAEDKTTQLSKQQQSITSSSQDNEPDSTSNEPLLELPVASPVQEITKEKAQTESNVNTDVPSIIQLMETASLITEVEKQAIVAQIKLAPEVSLEQLLLNTGYITHNEFTSLQLAQSLLAKGAINIDQFEVAMFDEHTTGLRMAESLQIRGWLAI